MPIVRNQTELTQNITRKAALWLSERGFKPVETEVYVDNGWVADIAGITWPSQTEKIELKLIKRAPRWPGGNSRLADYGPGDQERYVKDDEEWRKTRDAIPSPLSALIEVKTSVSDFRGDRKWTTETWPTNLAYIAMPDGLIPQDQWPVGWGVLLFRENGSLRHHRAPLHLVTTEQQLNVAMRLAVRRDHHTRYAREREWQQEVRIREGEHKTLERFQDAIRVATDVVSGARTVEDALRRRHIRAKLPASLLQKIAALAPTARQEVKT